MNVAVVGGAGAIGRATCDVLIAAGHTPVVLDQQDADIPIDVRRPESVWEAFAELGPVWGLVYAAGIQVAELTATMKLEQWDTLFSVNVRGAWLCIQQALPELERAVLVSSIAGIGTGGPQLVAYGASKAALISLGRGLAVELAPAVQVNVVAPGWTDTAFNDPVVAAMGGRAAQSRLVLETVPLRRQAEPGEIAEAIAYALSAGYMTGACLVVDGGRTLQ